MLKAYVARPSDAASSTSPKVLPVALASVLPSYLPLEDDLVMQDSPVLCARLQYSQVLSNLEKNLSHLSESHKSDVIGLIESHRALFSDAPTQTTVLKHDIDVGDFRPIKQQAYRVNPTKRAQMQKAIFTKAWLCYS